MISNCLVLCACLFGISDVLVIVSCDRAAVSNAQDNRDTSDCDLCELLVNSFNKGMKRTARERFGGGDAAWEEKNLGPYASSETRLVEIQEGLCQEDEVAQGVCHTLAEVWEPHLENWWQRDRGAFPDLKQYLCETIIKVCEPTNDTVHRCPPGFTRVVDKGCFDVNECLSNPCKHNEFCSNSEGSFSCSPCNSACDGCLGSGPDKCKRLKRKREKRSIEEILESGKLLNSNSQNLFVLLITVLVILLPCLFCVFFPLLNH